MLADLISLAPNLFALLSSIGAVGAVGLFAASRLIPAPLSTVALIASIVIGAPAILAWASTAYAALTGVPDMWAQIAPVDSLSDFNAVFTDIIMPVFAVVVTPLIALGVAVSILRAQLMTGLIAGGLALLSWAGVFGGFGGLESLLGR